ncbi:MAG TPA: MBL fold metallo-hydrolase [Anaeromyxobacteraceae bacterium]|nr:MBL fold metallo-hydrolase [Anaeromyxobacteraceae bacterium]
MTAAASSLKFLGTAGARFAVSTQLRHSGGLLWSLGGLRLWVDPGPGALVRALSARPPVEPSKVDALFVSHRHLDHAGDATAVVEAMTGGGFDRRGTLLAPLDALETEPVVFRYAQAFPARRVVLQEGAEVELGPGLRLSTPLGHDHGVETYGYRLAAAGLTAAHVVDTFWMNALPEAYGGVHLLLVNCTRLKGGDRRLLHLGADDAERLVASVRPRLAVLTHFGMQMIRARPEAVAFAISERTGVPTLAARDGMALDLSDLEALARKAQQPPPTRRPAPRLPERDAD